MKHSGATRVITADKCANVTVTIVSNICLSLLVFSQRRHIHLPNCTSILLCERKVCIINVQLLFFQKLFSPQPWKKCPKLTPCPYFQFCRINSRAIVLIIGLLTEMVTLQFITAKHEQTYTTVNYLIMLIIAKEIH